MDSRWRVALTPPASNWSAKAGPEILDVGAEVEAIAGYSPIEPPGQPAVVDVGIRFRASKGLRLGLADVSVRSPYAREGEFVRLGNLWPGLDGGWTTYGFRKQMPYIGSLEYVQVAGDQIRHDSGFETIDFGTVDLVRDDKNPLQLQLKEPRRVSVRSARGPTIRAIENNPTNYVGQKQPFLFMTVIVDDDGKNLPPLREGLQPRTRLISGNMQASVHYSRTINGKAVFEFLIIRPGLKPGPYRLKVFLFSRRIEAAVPFDLQIPVQRLPARRNDPALRTNPDLARLFSPSS